MDNYSDNDELPDTLILQQIWHSDIDVPGPLLYIWNNNISNKQSQVAALIQFGNNSSYTQW